MAAPKKRISFFESEEGLSAKHSLEQIAKDLLYNTSPSYSADITSYPNNLIPFVDKHMNYLNVHPNINPEQYISNLRLMTKKR